MTAPSQVLKIRRPDDWHLHFRDGDMLKTVVPYTSEVYGRAIVMPNLVPPVTTVDAAIAYRQRILDAVPAGHDFTPLMTCYLTDTLDPNELERVEHLVPESIALEDDTLVPFLGGETVRWSVKS